MRRWGVLAGLSLGRMTFGLQFQSVASAGPELVQRFGLDYAGLGALVGLYMAAGIATSLPSGVLGRWLGERVVVGAGLLLMAAGAVWTAMADGSGGIGWGRLVSGAGAVALVVMQGKVVADRFAGRQFMPAMGLAVGAFPVGVGLAGVMAAPLGWPGLAWAGVAPALLGAGVFVACAEAPGRRAGPRWSMPNRRECALVLIAGLVWTAYNGGYYAYLAYLPSSMAVRGHPAALIAVVMAAATWLNLPATLGGAVLASRWGSGRVLLAGTLAAAGGLVGAALLDWPIVWGVLLGSAGAVHAGVIIALGTLSTRPEHQAVGMGLFYTTYYAGGTLLPVLCGQAADWWGDPAGALLAGAGLAMLCLPIYAVHRAIQRVAQLQESPSSGRSGP